MSYKNAEAPKSFPVVAIGASADGLEAITELLKYLLPDLGMCYVVIQHLSPTHESILPELIDRQTTMKVYKVTDGIEVFANCVYVMPPNTFMSIVDGHLRIFPRIKIDGVMHPIDFFLTTLAEVYQQNAIAVILSGTATDGTAGVHAIKAAGGITFAQDVPAAFQGMPKSAVVSGFIDFVLSPEAIANELKEFSQITISGSLPDDIIKSSSLKKIFILLNNKTGVDFSHYKPTTITRRIIRRMNLNKVNSLKDYISILQKKTDELNFLYQDLLINVTSFFRDPELFEVLSKKIFPQLLKRRSLSEPIRIWIPACATGEEACSIAICLFEYLGDNVLTTPIQIFATDLSEQAIQRARAGIYLKSTLQNISAGRLAKFFVKIDSSYQILKSIRDVCVYATHNLIKGPPFSKMDIISCQNVMIYLGSNAQRKVLQSFHYALKLTGYLLLGKSESIGSSTDLFVQVNKDLRIFTKTLTAASLNLDYSVRQPFNSHGSLPDSDKLVTTQTSEADLIRETDKILLSQFVPASVVINKDLQILRFQGATANYLQPASGKASLNVLKMVKDELVYELRLLLHQAKKTDYIVRKEGINLIINNLPGKVSIEIIPIKTASENSHFLIVFQEKAIIPVPIEIVKKGKNFKDNHIRELEQQLKESREQMKMMTEEFEASGEELQSANEEILSSNEELQSMNEELETSKEELQSTNEELTTINEEVQHRNDDLKEAVNYAEAIVQTIREPLMVLNSDLHIRTANNAFYSIFKISQEETEGDYFYEIGNGQLDIDELKNELNDIILKNKSFENFELSNDFKTIGKKILIFNAVRMTQEDKKKNRYMLAIEDVTERRLTEKKLAESFKLNSTILHSINDIFISVNDNWEFVYVNQQAAKFIGKKENQLLGKNIWNELSAYKATILFKKIEEAKTSKIVTEFEFFAATLKEWYYFKIYPFQETLSIYAASIHERKRAEDLLKENEEKLRLLIQNSFDIITIISQKGMILYESDSIESILGYKPEERIEKNIFKDTLVHPEDKHLKEAMFKNALEAPNTDVRAEFRLLHKDGNYINMEAVCINLLNDFRINGIVANYRDITERKLLEKQKDQFIGIASHELKTPVTSIKGYAQILQQLFTESGDQQSVELIKKMDGQIDRLTNLIKELLDVTQISEGQLKLKKDIFNINELIREVVGEMQKITLKHTIITELEPIENNIITDREKTRQVLVNLISNAVKYSPNANKIIIRSVLSGNGITISVEDFGIGITDTSKEKIFDRFFRDIDPKLNTYPGLGLGLYICAEIIKRQGGKIWLESKKNIGSSFSFYLPFKNTGK